MKRERKSLLSVLLVLVLLLVEQTTQPILVQKVLLLLDCPIVPLLLLGQSAVFSPQMQQLHVLLLNLGL